MSKLKNTIFSLSAFRKLTALLPCAWPGATDSNFEKHRAGEPVKSDIVIPILWSKKSEELNATGEEKGDSSSKSGQRKLEPEKLEISYYESVSSKSDSVGRSTKKPKFQIQRFKVSFDDDASASLTVNEYLRPSSWTNSSAKFSNLSENLETERRKRNKRKRSRRQSLLEYYSREPSITVKPSVTSTKRIEQRKNTIKSSQKATKKSAISKKSIYPFLSQRDWRRINGIRLWADKFEKEEYVLEDGQFVNKYESNEWKKFVENIKLSVEKLRHVTKIHMPLLLPEFIIDMMERNVAG